MLRKDLHYIFAIYCTRLIERIQVCKISGQSEQSFVRYMPRSALRTCRHCQPDCQDIDIAWKVDLDILEGTHVNLFVEWRGLLFPVACHLLLAWRTRYEYTEKHE